MRLSSKHISALFISAARRELINRDWLLDAMTVVSEFTHNVTYSGKIELGDTITVETALQKEDVTEFVKRMHGRTMEEELKEAGFPENSYKNKTTKFTDSERSPSRSNENICGIGFNFKRNGKYLLKGAPGRAFKVMWPNNLPCGDPYIWETIDERAWESMVNGYRISDQFFLEPDGYWDFEPSF